MSVSRKIRQHASGILLLLLASFILASVSYIADIIPEISIPKNDENNPWLVYSTTLNINNKSSVSVSFDPYFNYTFRYRIYIVVNTAGLSPPASVERIWLDHTSGYMILYPTRFNDTVYYAYATLNSDNITSIVVSFNTTTSGVVLFSLYDTNNITQALTWRPSQPSFSISNKLVLNFISWVAGIILVIEALRRFDLEI